MGLGSDRKLLPFTPISTIIHSDIILIQGAIIVESALHVQISQFFGSDGVNHSSFQPFDPINDRPTERTKVRIIDLIGRWGRPGILLRDHLR